MARLADQNFRGLSVLFTGRPRRGVFITTGSFSNDAIAYVKHMDPRVVIIDGKGLAERMIKHDVGVTTQHTYHVQRVDSEYFDEGTA
jgi:restriction system protein